VAIQRQGIGLIIIDSIAANYRAEFDRLGGTTNGGNSTTPRSNSGQAVSTKPERRAGQAMAERKSQLLQLGAFLRDLARTENMAIVVANQVADRFSLITTSTPFNTQVSQQASDQIPPPATPAITPDPLTLDHQQRWFTGWGDLPPFTPGHTSLKTPSLGLVWTSQIAARIALIKEGLGGSDSRKRRRWMRVVFAPWAAQTTGMGIEYEILAEGVRAVAGKASDGEEEKVVEQNT
jgi:DNA repair protein RAD57